MAKLTHLPSKAIIDGFKGKIDFYVNMGIPCARTWPRSPGAHRAAAVAAQWPTFAFSGHYWQYLSLEVKEAFNAMAVGSPTTGREIFTKSFITTTTIKFS